MTSMMKEHSFVRCLAFYLPQFHPIPENDEAWGKGFTEWTNVARTRPAFPGHYQPHVPADLGFYDLRLPEAREAQASLAVENGIDGFVYYHYWFNGRQVLEHPFSEVLLTGEPAFPFCLAWANEDWTRKWDGVSNEVIVTQTYSPEDDIRHIRSLRDAFFDDRYIRWRGMPVLLVYRASKLPDPLRTTDVWRREVESWGLPGLYLLRIESFPDEVGDPVRLGFDGAVEFQPRWWAQLEQPLPFQAVDWSRRSLGRFAPFPHFVRSYASLVRSEAARQLPDYIRWPCVSPRWDNSPRRARDAFIFVGSSPERYRAWLTSALEKSIRVAQQAGYVGEPLLFVNAWNEWAEGNHLEPDLKFGRAYLEAHGSTVQKFRTEGAGPGPHKETGP
jgi:lipopolysaccharide biosynthesis protein